MKNRLIGFLHLLVCLFYFVLCIVTGVLQLSFSFMSFIVESLDKLSLRWNYIEWSYLSDCVDIVRYGIPRALSEMVTGELED